MRDVFQGDDALARACVWTGRDGARALGARLLAKVLHGRPTVLAFGGYSVTIGRGNYFAHAWPNVVREALAPAYAELGAPLVARNRAQGGVPSLPYGWCLDEYLSDADGDAALGGDDGGGFDVVGWEFSMNEPAGSTLHAETYARYAMLLRGAPALLIAEQLMVLVAEGLDSTYHLIEVLCLHDIMQLSVALSTQLWTQMHP